MQPTFKADIAKFIERLKKQSHQLNGHVSFERLMKGLSDGSVHFRWKLGGSAARETTYEKIENRNWSMFFRYLISIPFIFMMIIPVFILDVWISLYQAICFRLWKIELIKRGTYIVIDRHYLSYLRPYQKLNCMYCGYANGVMAYARKIAAETEKYWCPLKHEGQLRDVHDYYIEFADYNDEQGWSALNDEGE